MTTPWLWSAALGPLALLLAASGDAVRFARPAAAFALLVALAGLAGVIAFGPFATGTLGAAGIGFALDLDPLSAAMSALVAFVGLVVVAYSGPYLDGAPRQRRFLRLLSATLASVLLFILSGNLLQSWLAWFGASLALHGLLLFHPERRAGVLAARKKQIASRLGDLALLVALVFAYRGAGSLDLRAVLAAPPSPALAVAAVGLALAALVKSAQFPLHGWLLEVMETPTPVSALLHAGVLNAGGFLVLRYSPLIAGSPAALDLLLVVGALTAAFGSLTLLPQTSIKGALACSTIAQMGFMMLECGLGVFSAAALHIFAHSLYKAHAFLSSGEAVGVHRALAPPPSVRGVLAVALAPALVGGAALLVGETARQPGQLALAALLALGLAPLFAQAARKRPGGAELAGLVVSAGLIVALYLLLQRLVAAAFASSLAPTPASPREAIAAGLVVALFAVLSLGQALLPAFAERPFVRALRAHIANGFYVNTLVNRALLRLWPTGPAPRAS